MTRPPRDEAGIYAGAVSGVFQLSANLFRFVSKQQQSSWMSPQGQDLTALPWIGDPTPALIFALLRPGQGFRTVGSGAPIEPRREVLLLLPAGVGYDGTALSSVAAVTARFTQYARTAELRDRG
jgi:hypothetical protein